MKSLIIVISLLLKAFANLIDSTNITKSTGSFFFSLLFFFFSLQKFKNRPFKYLFIIFKVRNFGSQAQKVQKFGIEEVKSPLQNLFLWALLHNRTEIAKIFWRIGEVIFI